MSHHGSTGNVSAAGKIVLKKGKNMENFVDFIVIIFAALLIGVVLAYPTMLLWNWLMPAVFGLPKLTFLQTIALQVLVRFFVPTPSFGKK